ncbi:MAG: DUF433 domain-containing protein [Candidatus Dormibacteria bacterium]
MPPAETPSLHPLSDEDPRVTDPLLTFREASGYLGVPLSTFHSWTRSSGPQPDGRPVVLSLADGGSSRAIPFIGLVEGYVLQAFRGAGVPVRRIRPALARLDEEIGIRHALASRHLYTDGCEVLYDYAAHLGDDLLRSLTVVRSGQNVFPEIVAGYLSRVSWDEQDWPHGLRLPAFRAATVVVDPARAFGRPMLEHGGARVEDVLDRFRGGDGLAAIARDFEVPLEECEDVVRVALAQAA